jgi:hypothetical protein
MKAPWSDPGLRELLALAALAAFGCGLALAQDDFAFAVIFAVESALIIVERCDAYGEIIAEWER